VVEETLGVAIRREHLRGAIACSNPVAPAARPTRLELSAALPDLPQANRVGETARRVSTPFSYDQVPYPSHAFARTHPSALASMAALFGLEAPAPASCRVLELGCASGGNLIPMAHGLPGARCVGVDLSRRQVDEGLAWIEELGLKNCELRYGDILEIDDSWGTFDYVIAHGVYSWVPANVQRHILTILERSLSPNGVAYVSFNALPGWTNRTPIRDLLLLESAGITDPQERLAAASARMQSLLASELAKKEPGLHRELERLSKRVDSNVLHDELGELNEPLYYLEFAQRAAEHGLAMLGEGELQAMDWFLEDAREAAARWRGSLQTSAFPWRAMPEPSPRAAAILERDRAFLLRQQFADFFRHRPFHRSLLVRGEAALDRGASIASARRLHLEARAFPKGEVRPADDSTAEFAAPGGATMKSDHRMTKGMLLALGQAHPQTLTFSQALERASLSAGASPEEAESQAADLWEVVLRCAEARLVAIHAQPPAFVRLAASRPRASAIARLQARSASQLTNLRHESIELDDALALRVIPWLDGETDRKTLARKLAPHLPPGNDPTKVLESILSGLARHSLLEL